jgi:adenylate kinase
MIVFAIIWGAAIVALGWNLGGVASTTTNLEETVERIDQIRHEIAEIRIDLQAEEAEELREELRLLVDRARCLDPFGEMLEVPECQ